MPASVIESGIFNRLSTVAEITALVPAVRITPDRRTKDAPLPAITFRIGGGMPIKTLHGAHASLTRTDVDITAYGTTRLAVRNIINACAVAFDGYSGLNAGVTFAGVNLDSFETAYFEPAAGESQGVYAAMLTIRCMHVTL